MACLCGKTDTAQHNNTVYRWLDTRSYRLDAFEFAVSQKLSGLSQLTQRKQWPGPCHVAGRSPVAPITPTAVTSHNALLETQVSSKFQQTTPPETQVSTSRGFLPKQDPSIACSNTRLRSMQDNQPFGSTRYCPPVRNPKPTTSTSCPSTPSQRSFSYTPTLGNPRIAYMYKALAVPCTCTRIP